MTWVVLERTVCNLNKRELVQARDYIAYASVYHRALKERGEYLSYPLRIDEILVNLNKEDDLFTYVRICNLERAMFMDSKVTKNRARFIITDQALLYYTEKYREVLERAIYHLEQGRRKHEDCV